MLRRLLFSVGETPTDDEIARNVENAIRVFFAAYGPTAA
ncbi:MAG TPA: TetR/AcrR family transcriptional regulator C-terminal domain-containing protein [Microvirga sp.]|nr:TetR/AcrR family transcriptional regulator C-terminal domain-containing protein [Microvirga sp.]